MEEILEKYGVTASATDWTGNDRLVVLKNDTRSLKLFVPQFHLGTSKNEAEVAIRHCISIDSIIEFFGKEGAREIFDYVLGKAP